MTTDLLTYLWDKLVADGYSGLCGDCPRLAERNCPVEDGPCDDYCISPRPEYPEARGE